MVIRPYSKYANLCSPMRHRQVAPQHEFSNHVKVQDRTGTRADTGRKFMPHIFLMPFLTAAFLVAPTVLPSLMESAMAPGLSGVAQAAKNLNSSRSNIYRTTTTQNPGTTPKAPGGVDRMGGGGGLHTGGGGAARMGGGGGGRTK
jgi:hypothetical protein